MPPDAVERPEASELLDGQAAAAVERALHLEAVVGWRPEPREVGGHDAGAPGHQPRGAVHREARPVPEVVGAPEVEVVPGPENGGVARAEVGAGALQLRGADRLPAPDAAEVEQARRADHAVERELLDGGALGVEAQRPVEMGADVVRREEDAPLPRLRVLVEGPRGRVGEPHPELRPEIVDRHALVDGHAEVDHSRDGPHGRASSPAPIERGDFPVGGTITRSEGKGTERSE